MPRGHTLRHQIAEEAARILANQGYLSFDEARKRALRNLKIKGSHHLPNNQEVEQALLSYQQLFYPERHQDALNRLRQQALNAMQLLKPFNPRLVGEVLRGSADAHTPVTLHLYSDDQKGVILMLLERKIPWREHEMEMVFPKGRKERVSQIRFTADDTEIALNLLPEMALRNPPLDRVTGHPEKGAPIQAVEKLVSAVDQRLSIGT